MRRIVTMITVLLFGAFIATAQTSQVTGKVVDQSGNPVEGASVLVKGTKTGTSADAQGNFSVNARAGATLIISSINFNTIEVKAGSSPMTITLESNTAQMDEVVVAAGGIRVQQRTVGTSNTVIKAEELVAARPVNVASGLQGKVAGLQINATSSGVNPNFRLILRGQRSLTGNNQALVVLDNVIVPNEVLGNLNPDDIESINVLQGGGAAALYGSQASNGALIITTKKGRRGVNTVTVQQTETIEQVAFFPKFQEGWGAGGSAYGYDDLGRPAWSYLENQSYGPAFDGSMRILGAPLEDGRQDSARYSYNPSHNKFFVNGLTSQSDFSVSSGNEISTTYMAGQYATVNGTTPGDKYNRATLRVNGTRKLGDKFNLAYSTSYTQNRYDITTMTGTMYNNLFNMPLNVDVTRYKDWRNDPFANPNGFYNPWYQNPYFTKDNYRQNSRNDYLVGNVEIRFAPIKSLEFTARQGIVTRNYSNKNITYPFDYTTYAENTDQSSKTDIKAAVSDGAGYRTQLLSDLFARYNTNFNDFSIDFIAGGQWLQNQAKGLSMGASGLVIPGLFNISNRSGTPDVGEANYMARSMGVYGDVRLGYKNFLYIHGTGRNDWVSILAPEARSFFYPSVDVSFVASQALDFIKESSVIDELKIRGGWAKVGQVNLGTSSNFGAYYLLPIFSQINGYPYSSGPGYSVGNQLVAPSLQPEFTKTYEAGFDLSMFKNRFTLKSTYFDSKTDNQTVSTGISSTTGFTSYLVNTGQTSSKGIELAGTVTPIKNRDWVVTVGANYTYLENNVNFISADLPRLSLAAYTDGSGSYAVAGQSFPVIMGTDYLRDDQGRVIVDAKSGTPFVDETIKVLANATPKTKFGINGDITWKNLHLSFLFEYRGGYSIYNRIGNGMDWAGTGYRSGVFNRLRFVFPNSVYEDPNKPGSYIPNTNITVEDGNGSAGFWTSSENMDVTSNYVTSANFLKLRELVLAYDLPASVLSRVGFLKGATVSVQGRNLFMWMAKDNYYTDPEYSEAGNDSNGMGITSLNQTPPSRYFGATLSLKF